MDIILATHNKNKLKEFKELVKDLNFNILSLYDLDDYEDIVETGSTFKENSFLKANTIAKKYNKVTIADDSGLEVYALNNEPGLYSARYSGKGDYENNLLVLKKLEGISNKEARFVCNISIVYPNNTSYNFESYWEGNISNSIDGINGFGYDPIFIPKGYDRSVASLDTSIKSKESHRAKAFNQLIEYLNK